MNELDDLCAPSCRQLWFDVLHVGLRDVAAGIDPNRVSRKDFEAVCALAGIEQR